MSTLQFKVQTVEELRDLVRAQGGLAVVTMEHLKGVFGYVRPGVWARKDMSSRLHAAGLGHFPPELPHYQYEEVRIYDKGQVPLAELVQAVLEPSPAGDDLLRGASGGDSDGGAAALLAKVRALLA